MERSSGVPGRWRWARLPVVAAGLLLTERALVAAVGTPVAQAHALRSLGHGPVDPVAPLLAALALLAEALIGYVLAMLALRTLCAVTPSVGILSPQVHGKRGLYWISSREVGGFGHKPAKRSRAFRLALLVFAGMEDEGAKALNAYTWRIRFLFLKHPSLDRLADAPTEGAEAEH